MRLTLNNTVVFVGQASRTRHGGDPAAVLASPLSLALLAGRAGCRGAARSRRPARRAPPGAAELSPLRAADRRPRRTLPAARAPSRRRRGAAGGTLRVHLDGEPPNLMPLGDDDASVAAGDGRARLRDAARLQRRHLPARPGRELGRLGRRDAHRGARAQRRALARPPRLRRARRAGDARAAAAQGQRRRRRCAPTLADVAAIELVTERTVRFVLQAPVGSGAARAVRHARSSPTTSSAAPAPKSSPIARAAGRHRSVPVRGLGARQAHPPGARARRLGPARRASTRSSSTSTPTPCARSTARGAATSTCCRACSTSTTRSRSSRRRCTAATALYRLTSRRYSFLVVNHRALSAVRPALPARHRAAVGSQALRARAARAIWRGRSAGRRSAEPTSPPPPFDRPRAIALLEDAGYRDSDADGVRDRDGQPIRLTHARAGRQQAASTSRRARSCSRCARPASWSISVPTDAGHHHGAPQARRVRPRADDLAGAPDEDPARALRRRTAPSTTAATARARSTRCSTRLRARAGPGRARADPGAHRAACSPTTSR